METIKRKNTFEDFFYKKRLLNNQEQNLKRARELEELQRRKEAARAELENLKSGN